MGAFEDQEVKAIWAARGGYGSMRIFDLLDDSSIRKNPKIFIGYSDITALHLYLYQRFGLVTFHGPMVAKDIEAGTDHFDENSLLRAITSLDPMGQIHSRGLRVFHGSDSAPVSGTLLGGCLTLVNSLLATPHELDTRDSILFLEDTLARPFAIDRMLTQLKLARKFDHVRAIIFGEMTECLQTADQGYEIEDVLASCTADLGIPVAWGLESGHSPRGNLTLPLGVRATFDPSLPALQIDEAAVV
jgi:muramoyltetrapeptide carboxypeptidase